MLDIAQKNCVNGIDLDALGEATEAVKQDPANGIVAFRVRTEWTGQARSETTIDSCTLGGERIERRHKIVADEPYELLGTDSAPNPQELLGRPMFGSLMTYVSQEFDVVLIDTPAAGKYADATIIAMQSHGALIVTRQNTTRLGKTQQLAGGLEELGVEMVGAVLNNY